MTSKRILIAGIGNIFLADDGFGVEVAKLMADKTLPPGVDVVDFGIRGYDLAVALGEYDWVILVDAVQRGGAPGTLYVIEPDLDELERDGQAGLVSGHTLDPYSAFTLAKALGCPFPHLRIVGCEPVAVDWDEENPVGLSPPVQAGLGKAVSLIEELLTEILKDDYLTPNRLSEA